MKIHKTILFFFGFTLLTNFSFSQSKKSDFSLFSFIFQNDFVFNTDQYFTHAFKLNYSSANLSNFLLNNYLFLHNDKENIYTISIQQDLFTPKDFSCNPTNCTDMPFSANLILSYSNKNYDVQFKKITTDRIQIGLTGKYAFGEQMQNGIHSLLPTSSHVSGWENQIRTEFLLNYKMSVERNLLSNSFYHINYLSDLEIGEPVTQIDFGFALNLFDRNYFNFPQIFQFQDISLSITNKFYVQYIFYNTNLQGGLINKSSPYVVEDIENVVFRNSLIGELKIYDYNFSIGFYYLSKEFKNADDHKWLYFEIQKLF